MRWVVLVTGVAGIFLGITGIRVYEAVRSESGVAPRSQGDDPTQAARSGAPARAAAGRDAAASGRKAAASARGAGVVVLVHHCHDGDTCRVGFGENGAFWLNVRLAGIDAPEVKGRQGAGQPLGDAARGAINTALQGKTARLRQLDLDAYNRPIVELSLDARVINLELVESGLAEVYRDATKRLDLSPYLEAEARAKEGRQGIWGLSRYESPQEYRRRAR